MKPTTPMRFFLPAGLLGVPMGPQARPVKKKIRTPGDDDCDQGGDGKGPDIPFAIAASMYDTWGGTGGTRSLGSCLSWEHGADR